MIKNEMFVGNITTYKNYLRRCLNFEEPVSVSTPSTLLALLRKKYQDCGAYIYEINKY